MSDYIAPGGFYGHRSALKSVYYPPPQPVAEQLQAQGPSQLPPGVVPVINLPPSGLQGYSPQPIGQAPYVPCSSFASEDGVRCLPQVPVCQSNNPAIVNSDYAAAGWTSRPYHTTTASHLVVNQPSQRQQTYYQEAPALVENNAAVLDAARSEYEQALAQAQRAAERLNLLTSAPHAQFSVPSISQLPSGHQSFDQQQPAVPQQQSSQGYQSGFAATSPQVRFGNISEIAPAGGSSYRFEESTPPPSRAFNQGQVDSVYVGMPNNLYLASNRPRDYHYTSHQYQPSNFNQDPREESDLHAAISEENVRTAINSLSATVLAGVPEQLNTAQTASPARDQNYGRLHAANSDYHFDGLRGLNSALGQ